MFDDFNESFPVEIGEAKPEWDLSINKLKFQIMALEETDPNKQDYLARLNELLNNMCFPAYSPNYSRMYSICYNMFCQAIDNISTEMPILKLNYCLPLDSEEYPNSDECKLFSLFHLRCHY